MSGTASIIVSEQFFEALVPEVELKIHQFSYWGEGLIYLIVEYPTLPEGYNGVMIAYFDKGQLKFKRDQDT